MLNTNKIHRKKDIYLSSKMGQKPKMFIFRLLINVYTYSIQLKFAKML